MLISGLVYTTFVHALQRLILFLKNKLKYDSFKKEWHVKPMVNCFLARANNSLENEFAIQSFDVNSHNFKGRFSLNVEPNELFDKGSVTLLVYN